MFLHVGSREGELLSDAILRHLGFEEEVGKLIPPKSGPPAAADSTAHNELGGDRGARLLDLETDAYQFAENLETAQIMWRRYPDLVESEDFPEPFLSAHRRNSSEADPHTTHISVWDDKLVKAGILPKPRRIRLNKAAIPQDD